MDAEQSDDLKQYADRLEFACRSQMKRIAELEAEVQRLQAAAGAHGVLKSIYLNGELPESLRAKAASAAIVHETPKLMPERAPLDLTAEPEESLSQLHERQLARHARYSALTLEERSALLPGVRNRNGQDDPS